MSVATERPDELVDILSTDLLRNDDRIARLGMTIDTFQNIPGLVGFWPMSGVQRSTGDARDFGHGGLDLSYNGNPTYNIYNDLVPYIDLDGTGDFFSHADTTDLDMLGTETIYASVVRGLTMGGWFWFDDAAPPVSSEGLITKDNAVAGGRSYSFQRNSGAGNGRFGISVDGTAFSTVDTTALNNSQWYFLVGRFTPSTELAAFQNGTKTINVAAIPASIFNSPTALNIGAFSGGLLLDGRVTFPFLSANALPDAYINALFQQSRVLFGV